jgi:hypothetical protein
MKFYLGTHHPAWLARDLGIPLLVSHRRLTGSRTLSRASGPWAMDSGGSPACSGLSQGEYRAMEQRSRQKDVGPSGTLSMVDMTFG